MDHDFSKKKKISSIAHYNESSRDRHESPQVQHETIKFIIISRYSSELDSKENQEQTADKLQLNACNKSFMNNLSFSENHQQ